ncbi:DNA-binding transcriptional ArsR family regulator [Pedobacter sp. UYP30]|uniref:ArsR/SmtB family transcription factor n=1 Tax=Pedobacter sp. UYP30 TaxID=1756400 RepID=UPI003390CA81
MEVEEIFVSILGLICQPTRAKMLWSLLDGRAYTSGELATSADISATSASNHLSKLLDADILKVEIQGRHRYYSFSKPEVAYVIESLANLAGEKTAINNKKNATTTSGVSFCRTCYDHLAGFVGVKVTEALEQKQIVVKSKTAYTVTEKGWQWFGEFEIREDDFINTRRPLTRQCLDWSERRPHLAGQLGAVLLEKMLQKKWFKRVQFSREMLVMAKGREELSNWLGVVL